MSLFIGGPLDGQVRQERKDHVKAATMPYRLLDAKEHAEDRHKVHEPQEIMYSRCVLNFAGARRDWFGPTSWGNARVFDYLCIGYADRGKEIERLRDIIERAIRTYAFSSDGWAALPVLREAKPTQQEIAV